METNQIGKAYKAWLAYNHKQKKDRLKDFNPKRWLKVVNAIEGVKTLKSLTKIDYPIRKPTPNKRWTPARRKQFHATIEARRLSNGHA